MKKLTETVQSGDWKNEKHVPMISANRNGEELEVKVFVGEEIAHPNTLEHHISWIKLFFQPEGSKFPVEIGGYEFRAHGETDLLTSPEVVTTLKTDKKGTLYAMSYCNIHGLWENSLEV